MSTTGFSRRTLLGAGAALLAGGAAVTAQAPTSAPAGNNIEFENRLKAMRLELYGRPPTDIIKTGFRPIGGKPADFAVAHHAGREHFFYIERRLQEGTPFFPGHEIYFGHASTGDFFEWQVHDPVMLIRPGTWEDGHVWAPSILREGDEYVMCYTGLNRAMSQDLGLASSRDMFDWRRWETNPISPLAKAEWAAWWPDEICSCRDPYLFRHEERVWCLFTANTREGASCLALASTTDWKAWRDDGTVQVGPEQGYEPRLWAGHPQGSLESAVMIQRRERWILVVNASIRGRGGGCWIDVSDRMGGYSYQRLRRFWTEGACIEFVRHDGERSLIAGLGGGGIRFGEVDWSAPEPTARSVTREQLIAWQKVPPLR